MATAMKAITVEKPGGPAVIHNRPMPTLRPTYMIVKVVAVALNPADIVCVDLHLALPGSLLGCDYAGVVVQVGEDVERDFKEGDRVCGATKPADPNQFENGTFAEYVCVKADLQYHVPDHLSFEEASALGVACLTTGRCLFDKFDIDYPRINDDGELEAPAAHPRQVLVYGGSSLMGTMVIQFAKLANMFVLSTASSHNHDLVKVYGADVVVDYHSSDAPAELIAIADANAASLSPLDWCVDNISQPGTAAFCAKVLTPNIAPGADNAGIKKLYSTITPLTPELRGIKTVRTLGYSFLGEDYEYMGQIIPASKEDFESAKRFAIVVDKCLKYKKIRPHPVDVRKTGLEGVVNAGLAEMRSGNVSGKKLVYVWQGKVMQDAAKL